MLRAQYDLDANGIAKRVREFWGESKLGTLGEIGSLLDEVGERIPFDELKRAHERGSDSDHIDEVVYGIPQRVAK